LKHELETPTQAKSEPTQLHLMWAAHCLGQANEMFLSKQMQSDQEYVRAWAIQLALEDKKVEPETLALMEKLAQDDKSPVVRLYLASALQRMPIEQRWTIAQRLAQHSEDAKDHNLPLMVWYGVEPLVAADADRALAMFVPAKLEKVAHFVVRRAAADPKLHAALVKALADPKSFGSLGWMLEVSANALADQRNLKMPPGWAALYPTFDLASDSKVHENARKLALAFGDPSALPGLRRTLADAKADPVARGQALDALVRAKDAETVPILRAQLDDNAMRGAAIRALGTYDDVAGAKAILERFPKFSADEKRDALNTLSSRTR